MNKHFEQIGKKKFKLFSIALLIANDLYNASSLYLKYQDKSYIIKLINQSFKLTGQKNIISTLNGQFYDQLFILFNNALNASILLLILFHSIIYLLFYKETKAARAYVLSVTIVASLYYIITILNSFHLNFETLINTIQAISYIYIFQGIRTILPKKLRKRKS